VNVPVAAVVLAVVVAGWLAMPAAGADAAQAPPTGQGRAVNAASRGRPGPVTVRSFKPMGIRTVRLRERHGPVYFRSPLAEPTASDRNVDASVPLACGATLMDWTVMVVRVLGFPVEMAVRPPWQSEPLRR